MPPDEQALRPLRVTHVVFDLDGGGMETLVADLARRLRDRLSVSVISLSGREGKVGASIRPLLDEFHVVRPVPLFSMFFPSALARQLRALRPDVVHLHSGAWFKGALAARLAGVRKVVYTEHGREHHDPWSQRILDHVAARLTDSVVAVSGRLQTYLRRSVGVPQTKLRTVANGVDVTRFSGRGDTAELRAQLGIPTDALIIGTVGRLQPVKAHVHLVAAFTALRSMAPVRPPLHLVLCGDGPERAPLERQIHDLGVESVVHLTGWVSRPADYYRLFDIFALTSTSEGAPVSLMEAMSCGAIPVVTDVGANAEILGTDLAQFLVPAGDVPAIARGLGSALAAPGRAELRVLARRRVHQTYNLDRVAEEYERLYRSGMNAPATRPKHRTGALGGPIGQRW